MTEEEIERVVERSLVAYADVQIISTTIDTFGNVIVGLTSNDPTLNTNIIEKEVEEGLEEEYDLNIIVIVKQNVVSKQDITGFKLLDDNILVLLVISFGLLMIAIVIIICLLVKKSQNEKMKNAKIAEHQIEFEALENVTCLSGTNVIRINSTEMESMNGGEQPGTAVANVKQMNDEDTQSDDEIYSDKLANDTKGNNDTTKDYNDDGNDDNDDDLNDALYKKGNTTKE